MNTIFPFLESKSIALLFAIFVYGAMFFISSVLIRSGKPSALTTNVASRVGALDGLRGVLALGVFACHSIVFYRWKTTGTWETGPNAVIYHLGATSVALFFMVTGFLFTRKSLSLKIRWGSFYRDRLARLGPLYFVLVIVICAIVLIASHGEIHEPSLALALEVARWMALGAFGRPDINGYDGTWHIIAGVNWSLQYEVIFYVFAVPALYWIGKVVSPTMALVASLAAIVGLLALYRVLNHAYIDMVYAIHFLGGVAVAYAYSIPAGKRLLEFPITKWLGAAAAASLYLMNDNLSVKAVIASVVIFGSVVGGASIFGLLKTRAAIWLGDISYGIYLLHGLMLWVGYLLMPPPLSPLQFTPFILVVGALIVLLATFSYVEFELPSITYVKKISRRPTQLTLAETSNLDTQVQGKTDRLNIQTRRETRLPKNRRAGRS